jgi:hypothetical protein
MFVSGEDTRKKKIIDYTNSITSNVHMLFTYYIFFQGHTNFNNMISRKLKTGAD